MYLLQNWKFVIFVLQGIPETTNQIGRKCTTIDRHKRRRWRKCNMEWQFNATNVDLYWRRVMNIMSSWCFIDDMLWTLCRRGVLMISDFSYFIFNVELLFCRVEHDRGKWFPLKTWLTQVIHYSLRIVLLPFGVAIVVFTVITKKKLQSNLVCLKLKSFSWSTWSKNKLCLL